MSEERGRSQPPDEDYRFCPICKTSLPLREWALHPHHTLDIGGKLPFLEGLIRFLGWWRRRG